MKIILFIISKKKILFILILISLIFNIKSIKKIIFFKKYKKDEVLKGLMRLSFWLYISLLISIVYFPITIASGEYVVYKMPAIHLEIIDNTLNLYKATGKIGVILNVGGNLLLLAPMAFFLCYYFESIFMSKWRIFLASLFISLFIECSQVTLSVIIPNVSRSFDVSDLICNTISGLLGYAIYKITKIAGSKVLGLSF